MEGLLQARGRDGNPGGGGGDSDAEYGGVLGGERLEMRSQDVSSRMQRVDRRTTWELQL